MSNTYSFFSWLNNLRIHPQWADRSLGQQWGSCAWAVGWWSTCTPHWLGSFQGSWVTRCNQWNPQALLRTAGLQSDTHLLNSFCFPVQVSGLEPKPNIAAQETCSGYCCLTFALHDVSGAVEVGGGVSGAGDAIVLSKLPLVRACRTADAAMGAGVVVMSWRALDCRSPPTPTGFSC